MLTSPVRSHNRDRARPAHEPISHSCRSFVAAHVGFDRYVARWLTLLERVRGTVVTHFAFRLDDFLAPTTERSPLAALCSAAADTDVTVILSSHAFGTFNIPIASKLAAAGVTVRWSPARIFGSMHLKATLFGAPGEHVAMLGSADLWSARLDVVPERRGHRYVESHEFGIELAGPLAASLHKTLEKIVEQSKSRPTVKLRKAKRPSPEDDAPVLLTGFPPPGSENTFRLEQRLCEAVRSARRSVYIEDQYFSLVHPDGWKSNLLVELASALDRGVAVTIVLPSRDWQSGPQSIMGLGTSLTVAHLYRLFGAADDRLFIAVRRGSAAPVHSHSKVMVVDQRLLITGSANLCRRSFFYDSELSVFVDDPEAARASLAALLPGLKGHLDADGDVTAKSLAQVSCLHRLPAAPMVRASWWRVLALTKFVDADARSRTGHRSPA